MPRRVRYNAAAPPVSRRQVLATWAAGFGGLALAGLTACSRTASSSRPGSSAGTSAKQGVAGPAKHVIFLYMDGGPSQIDTFDPKPRLAREHGQPIKLKTPATQFHIGQRVLKSPFRFAKYGECGADVSELFPHLARHVDRLAFVRSMVSDHSEHTAANFCLHTGVGMPGRPSMGAWVSYGLGVESEELPGFVVLDSGNIPLGGEDCFGAGFLPARHQATLFRKGSAPIADLQRSEPTGELQRAKLSLAQRLNRHRQEQAEFDDQIDAVIASYEQAFRMQSAVPKLVDISEESQATLRLYGIDDPLTEAFGRQCLLARRMVERGVRFVQLLPPKLPDHNRWDQHSFLAEHHRTNALAVDKPIAGLLADLAARGLLGETVVLWGGEFGRTPMAQEQPADKVGRDHNPYGFTMWLAGGGVRGGVTYGGTDDYGYFAVPGSEVHVHDLHATLLHLLGIDHTQLTYEHSGRHFRLTDVYGRVVQEITA
ncbi:MAG: DUF1501 domain-containing protein [Pirellulales bacterium]|nr:DUF1501 domain-containing protein [Pirellulales bacterium]